MSYTVNALIAEALHVDAALVGVPSAVTVLGTAIGSSLLMRGRGRGASRRAMLGGYLLATGAAIAAASAIGAHQFWLFVATALVFGVGYGANRIARYSAAALYPAAQRGTVIGWIVWAATIGAVIGPSLLELASRGAAERRHGPADRPVPVRGGDAADRRRRDVGHAGGRGARRAGAGGGRRGVTRVRAGAAGRPATRGSA